MSVKQDASGRRLIPATNACRTAEPTSGRTLPAIPQSGPVTCRRVVCQSQPQSRTFPLLTGVRCGRLDSFGPSSILKPSTL